MQPHPEGGYFRETYRSAQSVISDGITRSASTAIHYLLDAPHHSAWHRIDADELWHFHAGTPLALHVIGEDGVFITHLLGSPERHGDCALQIVVPAGRWFAAEVHPAGGHPGDFALVSCTVAPGFEFSRFELADRATLQARYPEHAELIARLAPR